MDCLSFVSESGPASGACALMPVLRASRAQAPPIEEYRYRHIQAPASVDWRAAGVVGPVKDQHVGGAPCGCCWAFATTGCAGGRAYAGLGLRRL